MTPLNTIHARPDHTPAVDAARTRTDCLDALMREARCRADGTTASESAIRETDRLAAKLDLPPVLTYEAIIFFNPLDSAPRTFLTDPDGRRDEIMFYRTHRDIERELYPVVRGLLDLLTPEYRDINTLPVRLQEYAHTMRGVTAKLGMMHRELSKDHFDRMRPYFGTPAYRTEPDGQHYPGPSGASSAAFVALDVLLGIARGREADLADTVRPITAWQGYSTVSDIEEARTLVAAHGTLEEAYSDTASHAAIAAFAAELAKFRAYHRWTARKFAPQAFAWGGGTGWVSDVETYLVGLIDSTKAVVKRLTSFIKK